MSELRDEHRVAVEAMEERHQLEMNKLRSNCDDVKEAWEAGRREEEAKWRKEVENMQRKHALEMEEAKVERDLTVVLALTERRIHMHSLKEAGRCS